MSMTYFDVKRVLKSKTATPLEMIAVMLELKNKVRTVRGITLDFATLGTPSEIETTEITEKEEVAKVA